MALDKIRMHVIEKSRKKSIPVSTVLFDLDGTLIELKARLVDPVVNPLLRFRDDIPMENINAGISELIELMKDKNTMKIPVILWNISKALGLRFWERIRYLFMAKNEFSANKRNFTVMESTEQLLRELSKQYQIGIVTSATREDVDLLLEEYPFFNLASVIITRDEVKEVKPHPEPLLNACSALGIIPEEAIYVGDLPTDIIAAKEANMRNIAFLAEFKEYTLPFMNAEYPDYYIEDLTEIPYILKNL